MVIPTVMMPTVMMPIMIMRCMVIVIMPISVRMTIWMGIRIVIGATDIEPLTSIDGMSIAQMVDMQQIMHG